MKLVDKLVLRELMGTFAWGVTAFSSVFFAGSYLLQLTSWLMDGLPLITAAQIVMLYLPSIVVYTLPMSTLLAVLLSIGRISGESELVSLYAGGISLYRIALPILIFGFAVSALSFGPSEGLAPLANVKNQDIQAQILQKTSVADTPFMLKDDGTGSVLLCNGGFDKKTGTLKKVSIIVLNKDVPKVVYYASRAVWAGMTKKEDKYHWKLYDGFWQTTGDDSCASSTFKDIETREVPLQKTPEELELFQRNPEQLSMGELSRLIGYVKAAPDRPIHKIRELEVQYYNKFSLPVSSFIFALLAAPLGIRRHRSHSSVGLGLSILLILAYWLTWHYTSSLAIQGKLSPAIGAFSADIVSIVAGFILLRKAAK